MADEKPPQSAAALIAELREAALSHKRMATLLMWSILILLVGGGAIFVFSPAILRERQLAEARRMERNMRGRLDAARNQLAIHEKLINALAVRDLDAAVDIARALEHKDRAIACTEADIFGDRYSATCLAISKGTNMAAHNLTIAEVQQHKVKENAETMSKLDKFDSNAAALRATTAALLIFLVRFLIRMHHYRLRLATFYETRAQIVEQWPGNLSGGDLLKVLQAEHIGFGDT